MTCLNLSSKNNFQCQKWSKSFGKKNLLKNISLGEHFLIILIFETLCFLKWRPILTVHLKVSESQSKQIFDFTELKKTYSSFCWFMSTKLHHCWSKVTLESTNSTSKIDAVAHDLLKCLQKYQWARLLEANRQGSTNSSQAKLMPLH